MSGRTKGTPEVLGRPRGRVKGSFNLHRDAPRPKVVDDGTGWVVRPKPRHCGGHVVNDPAGGFTCNRCARHYTTLPNHARHCIKLLEPSRSEASDR